VTGVRKRKAFVCKIGKQRGDLEMDKKARTKQEGDLKVEKKARGRFGNGEEIKRESL
jgi:hypothetical protein